MSNIDTLPVAGFWRRFASMFLDGLLFSPFAMGGVVVMFIDPTLYLIFTLAIYVLLCVYYIAMLSSRWQATLGMRAMKVYGTDVEGKRLGATQALKWVLVSIVFCGVALAPLYYIMPPGSSVQEQIAAFQHPYYWHANIYAYCVLFAWALTIGLSKRRIGLHNKLAKTRFVKGRV